MTPYVKPVVVTYREEQLLARHEICAESF